MMKFYFLCCIFFACGHAVVLAQTTTLEGQVRNMAGKAVVEASVVLYGPTKRSIVAFQFTDKNGAFRFTQNSPHDSLVVVVSGMNVKASEQRIRNASQQLVFVVREEALEIKAVVVTAAKIEGTRDTINYRVASFASEQDRVIGDVLAKLPGITVAESGQVSYQGKPINKFYIEGMDLLQGRYGIATKNISVKDIATVQVLENHQPIKALQGVSASDKAAINLRLRQGARGALLLMAQAGVGAQDHTSSPVLWDNVLTAMYFARTFQNISLYKGNNTGDDLYKELRSFTGRDIFGSNDMVSVRMPAPPSIRQNRYLFNNAHAGSVNTLFKDKRQDEFTFNLIYLNDNNQRESRAQTQYLMPDNKVVVLDEELSALRNINRAEAEFRYNRNQPHYFINNYLNVSGLWHSDQGTMRNANQELAQHSYRPSFAVSDNFNLVSTTPDRRGVNIRGDFGFKNAPQTLSIYPGLYPEVLNDAEPYAATRQLIDRQSARANLGVDLLSMWNWGPVRFDPKGGVSFRYDRLSSDLLLTQSDGSVRDPAIGNARNDMQWFEGSAWLGLGLRYQFSDAELSVDLPVALHFISINDRIRSSRTDHWPIYFQPRLSFNYPILASLKLNASYNFGQSTSDIQSMYTGTIMQDYHSFNRYDELLPRRFQHVASASLEYKDMVHMFFASASASYLHATNSTITQEEFQDVLIVTTRALMRNAQSGLNANARLSKGFDWATLLIGAEVGYGQYAMQQLRQGVLADYTNDVLTVAGTLSMRPAKWFTFDYKGSWSRSWSRVTAGQAFAPIDAMAHTASAAFTIVKGFDLKLAYELYYNSAAQGQQYFSLGDVGLNYRLKGIDMSLECNNVFNTKSFVTAYSSALNEYRNEYAIRPLSLMFRIKFKIK